MGTPAGYAPPEQFAGQATPTSDIYALGATLHHLITGKHPLKATVPFQFVSIRERGPELSPALDAVLLEMVRIDASLRPSVEDVKTRFERLSGTQVAHTAFVRATALRSSPLASWCRPASVAPRPAASI